MILPKSYELLDLDRTIAAQLLRGYENAFEVLPELKNFIERLGPSLSEEEYYQPQEGVYIAKDAKISETATILPPTVIGHGAQIRPGAYIRGSVIIGNGAVIGNSTELKNAIIFDEVQLPHYNYVGDSILGYRSHLGAGAVISNFKLDHKQVKIRSGNEVYETGMRKFGAIIGDFVEVGCGSVIFPGTIIGRNTLIYPLTPARGVIPENTIVHSDGALTVRELD